MAWPAAIARSIVARYGGAGHNRVEHGPQTGYPSSGAQFLS